MFGLKYKIENDSFHKDTNNFIYLQFDNDMCDDNRVDVKTENN